MNSRHIRYVQTIALRALLCFALFSALDVAAATGRPTIGVLYFPGWTSNLPGHPYPQPWQPIKNFPERKPLLGWYSEGSLDVARSHMTWMRDYGVDFVTYSWYWDGKNPAFAHAIDAYRALPNDKPRFAVMWANHATQPTSGVFFYSMVRFWIENYFKDPKYLRINGMPVAFIMLGGRLDEKARAFGSSADELLAKANQMAIVSGLPGIYFVGGGGILRDKDGGPKGFSAYFNYNLHSGPGNKISGENRMSRNYSELDQAYQEYWKLYSSNSNAPFITPLTAGWDKRPWGGSADPLHDNSSPRDGDFEKHLVAARDFLASSPHRSLNMALICCWNEFGEGSYIEPTQGIGFSKLRAIRNTFGVSNE